MGAGMTQTRIRLRDRMRGLVCVAVIAVLPAAAHAQATADASAPFDLKAIGPGVYAAIDKPAGKSGSNAGFIIGDDGVLVVDSFSNVDAAKALLAEIRKMTPKPVRYVVNTHYHYDHVGGDAVFAEAGAVIIAHRNVRAWVKSENPHLFGDKVSPVQQARLDALIEPNVTVETGMTVWLGARRVDVRFAKGHTGGDLVVAIPDAHVLFCGDLLWRKVSPNVIDGTINDWIATDATFEKMADASAASYVPGHGDVGSIADVAEFRGYLVKLRDLTAAARKAGLAGPALVAEVLPKLKATYGGWAAFDYFAAKEIGFMEDELKGVKRTPKPTP
jgi:glyoxylase-like metal-dependent hydrolase (beta-lactamase superfamily II)